jgi:hypothetical protein
MSDYNSDSGKKTTTALITILGIGLVVLLLCCGGAYWIGSMAIGKFQVSFSTDAAQIRTMTATIVDVTIPEEFPPLFGMDMSTFGAPMKMVFYGTQDQSRSLVLMQMIDPSGNSGMTKEQFEQAMRQQGAQQGGQMQQINATSAEQWIFDFSGEEYTFEMASGTDPARNVAAHRLTGVFPGKQGAAFLSMMMNDDDWDEESVLQMIESMGGKLLRKETIGVTGTETISEGSEGAATPDGTATPEDTPAPDGSGETTEPAIP